MGLRINTNLASIRAQREITKSEREVVRNSKQLASGSRFADSSVGAADYAIAEHLRGQISALKSARQNADSANSFIQVAEGGLNEQNNIMIRLRELSVQAASDTVSDDQRELVNLEFQQLLQESDRIAKTTTFGSHALLTGQNKSFEFQVGPNQGNENIVRYESHTNTTNHGLGINGLAVDDKSGARDALETLDGGLGKIAEARASFGAIQSRLTSASDHAAVMVENLSDAHSRIADTDYAQASADLFRNQALQQYQVAVLAQANQSPRDVMRLIA